MAFAVKLAARLLLFPPEGGLITTRQASLNAADRLVAPPKGLSTLGFDPARFQTEPPACYRASWQLPGRDSHPQATTSLCWITYSINTNSLAHAALIEHQRPRRDHEAAESPRRCGRRQVGSRARLDRSRPALLSQTAAAWR